MFFTRGIHHCTVRCTSANIAAVRRFYTRELALVEGPAPRGCEGGHWLYSEDQPVVHLTIGSASPGRPDASPPALTMSLRAHGLSAAKVRLRAHGITFMENVIEEWSCHELVLQDPAGNTIGLTFDTAPAEAQLDTQAATAPLPGEPRQMRDRVRATPLHPRRSSEAEDLPAAPS